jgi:hypothetical protein
MTHCQICARAIKAKSGVIADHGYTQPDRWHGGYGSGWRTRSCAGARHVPYEVGHDALDRWITDLERWIPERELHLANLREAPPASYEIRRTDAHGRLRPRYPKTVTRPKGWTPASPRSYMPESYDGEYHSRIASAKRDLRDMHTALSEARTRRATWRAP